MNARPQNAGWTEVEKTRRSYDLVADRYAEEIGSELAAKPLDRALLDALAEICAGGVVADIGCGPGHVAAYLAARGLAVVGIDVSPAMCSLARRGGVPAAAADMTALPLRSCSVAGIVCWYAVMHLDPNQRTTAYQEMRRGLRPGGYALVAFHTSDSETAAGGSRRLSEWWEHRVDLTFRFLDAEQEGRLLEDAGLQLVARTDREPQAEEHQSRRSYLLARAVSPPSP